MGVLLSVYSSIAYKEYILPPYYNGEELLVLKRNLFGLREDVVLNMETINGKWRFKGFSSATKTDERFSEERDIHSQDSISIITGNGERLYVIFQIRDSFFAAYDKYSLTGKNKITLGSGRDQDISYSFIHNGRAYVSEKHAVMRKTGNGWEVEGISPNGTFLNNQRIRNNHILKFGDHINIWGMDIVFLGDVLGVSRGTESEKVFVKLKRKVQGVSEDSLQEPYNMRQSNIYHRSPRNIEPLETEPIEIESPPVPRESSDVPLFMQIGPSMTMMIPMMMGSGMAVLSSRMAGNVGSGFMYTGLITAACSGAIGVFWAINNIKYAEKRRKQEETHRFNAYSEYLLKRVDRIKKAYECNRKILLERYPSIEEVFKEKGVIKWLWGRNYNHEDFLYHRLGIGDISFQVKIAIPKEKFSLIQDSLAEKPELIKENYKILRDVPVGIDLMKHSLIGIAGGDNKSGADPIVYNLSAQIAVQNCYTDVKIVFLSSSDEWKERWKFALWLPHVWSEGRKFRFIAYDQADAEEVLFELTEVLRRRFEQQREGNLNSQKMPMPYYVLFVEDERLISETLIEKYIYCRDKKLGLTTIFLAEQYEDLPNRCEYIIRNDGQFAGLCNVCDGENGKIPVKFDTLSAEEMDVLARSMTSLKVNEKEIGGEIPSSISFFEMYGVNHPEGLKAEERWRKNRIFESMKALIGVKRGGEPCYLDLHEKYHGPHGLMAGTTGSGKSETLQTYILSLALNFSPDDVGFFIIDYKGGGMGNLFSGLPHVLGQISNLSGNQIQRALISIKSENLRRQRLFNENDVNNINSYTNLYKNGETKIPIPHLFIIIDEFAELKREEPEFMRELISVAQVGRSLGVHLILATQKPAGTVDDNIWSNAKFRICLRVQDRQDSMDMLHKTDAAYLIGAGRGYLQVGNDELYELFQSGWSGAEYDEGAENSSQILARMLTVYGKTAIVGNHEKSRRKAEARIKWLYELIQYGEDSLRVKEISPECADEEIIDAWQKQLKEQGAEHLETEHGRRLLNNLKTLYREAREGNKDIFWIIEQAEERRWKLPEKKKKTQLDAVIEYLAGIAEKEGYEKQPPLWLPILPSRLGLRKIWKPDQKVFYGTAWPENTERFVLKAEVGLCDDPVNRLQEPLVLNFTEDGNHAVCGLTMSGKSTFLQTVIYSLLKKYSPQYLNIYALDFSSRMLEPFEQAPQVGGILYENDLDTIGKLFHMLEDMLNKRKQLFRGGNFSQYTAKHGVACPAVLVVIDQMAAFREKTESKYDDIFLRLSRECAANGIYFLISGSSYGMADIPSRLKETIRKNICLELQDKYQYVDILSTTRVDTLPETGIPGRGLVKTEDGILEFQTCLASEAEDDYSRLEEIRKECLQMAQCWKGRKAKQIPQIPEKPGWSEFQSWEEAESAFEDKAKLPIGYIHETAEPYSLNLKNVFCCTISGKSGTGKTNLLKIMMRSAAKKGGKLIVIEFSSDELKKESDELGARYITNCEEYFNLMIEMLPEMVERNKEKKQLRMQKDADDEEIFWEMSSKLPYFIFIADLVTFSQTMHGTEGKEKGFDGFTVNLLEKGGLQNFYFVGCFNPDKRTEVQLQKVYQAFTNYKTGIHLGGNCDGQTHLNFASMSYNQLKEVLPVGHGYTSMPQGEETMKIVIPSSKG